MTLFTYGDFNFQKAEWVSYALMVYMLGLPAFVINKVLLPAFYSRKDTKTPVKIAVKAMLLNVVLNFAFVGLLWYLDVVSLHVGLAMAGVGSAWVQSVLLYRALKRDGVIQKALVSWAFLGKLLMGLVSMALVLFFVKPLVPSWVDLFWYQRFGFLSGMISLAALVYFVTIYLAGLRIKTSWKS